MVTRAIGVTSVWDLVPDDAELYSGVFQEHFADTNLQVIAIFKTLKVSSQADGAHTEKLTASDTRALGHAGKMAAEAVDALRILVITVDRRAAPPDGKPCIHKYGVSFETGALQYAARGAAMSLSLLKAVHLLEPPKDSTLANVLGTVWAAKPKTKGGQLKLPVLPQGFIQPSKNSTPFHYAFPTASRRVTCACCLFCVARTFAGRKPNLHGMSAEFVDGWLRRNAAERPSNVVPSELERRAFVPAAEGRELGSEWARLSEKDASHLSGLLDIVMSTGDLEVGAIRERLEAEFTALEAANVHAILDSTAAAPKVVKKIDVAFGKLEDLELTLDVFDGKLSAMRDDIATIEARNNSLETQTRSLERLQRAVQDLLASLTASQDVQALATVSVSERHVPQIVAGLVSLTRHVDSLKVEEPGRPGLKRDVAGMHIVGQFRQALHETLQAVLDRVRRQCEALFSGAEFLARDGPPRLLAEPPGLACAPLLHLLTAIPDGQSALSDMRGSFLAAMAACLNGLVRGAATGAEKAVAAWNEDGGGHKAARAAIEAAAASGSKGAALEAVKAPPMFEPVLQMLQSTLPTLTHCLMYAMDFLCLRAGAETQTTTSLTGPIAVGNSAGSQAIVSACLARGQARSAQQPDRSPPLTLRALLSPTQPLSEAGQEALARVTAGLLDPVRRLAKVIAARSYVPLIPVVAVVAAWRDYLSRYPAAGPLANGLSQVLHEASGDLERAQGAVAEAAERAAGDSKAVKDLGVLPSTRQLAADCIEALSFLRTGLPPLRWSWPQGGEEVAATTDEVTRHAFEPASRAVGGLYRAYAASLGRLGDRDAKHGSRLTLENLHFLQPHLAELSRHASDLGVCAKELASNLAKAQDDYVLQQLQHGRLWPLLLLAGNLRGLLKDVRPGDVKFQQGYSQATVASTIEGGYGGMDKKLKEVSARTRKHLGHNPRLLKVVWDAVQGAIVRQLQALERDVAACFPGVSIPIPAEQVAQLLRGVTP